MRKLEQAPQKTRRLVPVTNASASPPPDPFFARRLLFLSRDSAPCGPLGNTRGVVVRLKGYALNERHKALHIVVLGSTFPKQPSPTRDAGSFAEGCSKHRVAGRPQLDGRRPVRRFLRAGLRSQPGGD